MPANIIIGGGGCLIKLSICINCGQSEFPVHEGCGVCQDCCTCGQCATCGSIYLQVINTAWYCYGCGGCIANDPDGGGCCKCMTCRNCGLAITEKTRCPICYKGLRGLAACHCCNITSGLHFIKRDIKLENVPAGAPSDILPSLRLCAAEVEVSTFHKPGPELDLTLKKWKASVVHDGTVSAEINTSPAKRGDFIQQICEIYDGLALCHAEMTLSAGCHIHVDARNFGYYEMAKLMYVWAAVEPALFTMVYRRRRANTFCVPCGMSYYQKLCKGLEAFKGSNKSERNIFRALVLEGVYGNKKTAVAKVKRDKGAGPRYRAVNIHSWLFRGSLEFRLPPGMVDPYDVVMWAATLSQIVDNAYEKELVDVQAMCEHLTIKPEHFSSPQHWSSTVRKASREMLLSIASGVKHEMWIKKVYNYFDENYDSESRSHYLGMCKSAKKEDFV